MAKLIASLAVVQHVTAAGKNETTSKATTKPDSSLKKETEPAAKETKAKEPATDADSRGKRNLELGYGGYNYYQTAPSPYRADRRISNAYQDQSRPPYYNNYVHHPQALVGPPPHHYHGFESDISNSVNNYQPGPPIHHHQPVYLEAPEPIIEIIIKESNESAPYDTQVPLLPNQKKKKEEVQVFYVKYHKDEKNGIVLDTPVPALKPLPDESEEEQDDTAPLHEQPIVVTPGPPQKTTTLRAIINPDSEKYHSNSGIRISFGTEDKHQQGHQISETESESVAQPVVALPLPGTPGLKQGPQQQPPQHQQNQHFSSQHKADQFYQQHQQFLQQRSFPTAAPFAAQPQFLQQPPHPQQNYVQNFGPSTPAQPPQQQQPQQYRPQPQYQFQQFQAPPQQQHRFQHFDQGRNYFNQPFNSFFKQQQLQQVPKPPQNIPALPPPEPASAAQPLPPYQPLTPQVTRFPENRPQPQPQPAIRGNFVDVARPVQGGLVQQAAPNLGTTRTPDHQTTAAEHQGNLKNILPPGGELVQSVPKYETHITEHIKDDGQKQSYVSTQFNHGPTYKILPSQELISHSVAPQVESQKNYVQAPQPLPTPQQYVSKQAAGPQIIPNSEPLSHSQRIASNQPAFGTRTTAAFPKTPVQPTTTRTTTQRPTTTTPSAPVDTGKKQKAILDLPDEVPDDIRQHLLSSGILDNADISVLDYDKLGETALENLPPEHLANFFSSGGASQIAGSNNVVSVVKPNGDKLPEKFISKNYDVKDKRVKYVIANQPPQIEESEEEPTFVTMPEKQNVDLKVVRFDPSSQKNVTDRYIKHDSTILPSVDIAGENEQNDQIYNRYLPLKINGAQFPIPDAPELRGRRISSVVVLAPVDNLKPNNSFVINAEQEASSEEEAEEEQSRFERDVLDSQKVKFIAGEALKQLIKKPSTDNFKRWLEKEGKTEVDLQSVVLLVTRNEYDEQEIFMYDITTKGVTHLNGELSQQFVKVAEENANTHNLDDVPIVDSGILEQMETAESSNKDEDLYSLHGDESSYVSGEDDQDEDEQAEPSENVETVVKFEQKPMIVYPVNSKYRPVQINSGYSSIKN
ncbi:hypothetical protein quinque_004199 [Culex quinquefasciatus]